MIIVTTIARVRQLVAEKTTPKSRNEQEIAGYRNLLNIIHENFDVIPISRNYILQLHKIMYSYLINPMAGQTKNVQNYISATYPDGHTKILFTPLPPYETPGALDSICEEYNRVIGNFNPADIFIPLVTTLPYTAGSHAFVKESSITFLKHICTLNNRL